MGIMCFATVDRFYGVRNANEQFFHFIGSNEYYSLMKLVHDDYKKNFEEAVKKIENGGKTSAVIKLRRTDGEYRTVFVKLFKSDYKKELFIDLEIYDVLDLVTYNKALEEKLTKYDTLLYLSKSIFFEYNSNNDSIKLYYAQNSGIISIEDTTLSAWRENVVSGELVTEDNRTEFNRLCDDIENGAENFLYEFYSAVFSKSNVQELYMFSGTVVKGMKHIVMGIAYTIDEKSVKRTNGLFDSSNLDALTGMLNKKAITDLAIKRINSRPDYNITLVIVDIDNFKEINDNFGHLFGDETLLKVSSILKDVVGTHGYAGRIGGDEFFVIFEGIKDKMDLRAMLRTIRTNIECMYMGFEIENLKVTCSMGAVQYPKDGDVYNHLFKIADRMLYLAKEKGKNRYIIFDSQLHGDYIKALDEKKPMEMNKSKPKLSRTEFMCRIIEKLSSADINSVEEALAITGKYSSLDRINFYWGKQYKNIFCWGSNEIDDVADYILTEEYKSLLNSNNVFIVNHVNSLEAKNNALYTVFNDRGICTVVQCLLGSRKNIRGMLSFELFSNFKKWTEDELFCFSLIGRLIYNAMISIENIKL